MPHISTHHRPPRAGIDPIDDEAIAFATIAMSVHRPLRDETIAVLLDSARRGLAIVVVTGTVEPDSVVDVVECVTQGVHGERVGAVVVASVRPGEVGPDVDDVDRWLEMSDIASDAGVELLEWFVIGHRVRCPRDDLGEAPRW